MSISRYDEDGAWTSHHTHCCIGARRATHCATHCATGDDMRTLTTPSLPTLCAAWAYWCSFTDCELLTQTRDCWTISAYRVQFKARAVFEEIQWVTERLSPPPHPPPPKCNPAPSSAWDIVAKSFVLQTIVLTYLEHQLYWDISSSQVSVASYQVVKYLCFHLHIFHTNKTGHLSCRYKYDRLMNLDPQWTCCKWIIAQEWYTHKSGSSMNLL